MHIGLVGLGRMGNNMRTRMRAAGIEVTGYDPNPDVTDVVDLAALVDAGSLRRGPDELAGEQV